jgi:hypothetical protein
MTTRETVAALTEMPGTICTGGTPRCSIRWASRRRASMLWADTAPSSASSTLSATLPVPARLGDPDSTFDPMADGKASDVLPFLKA